MAGFNPVEYFYVDLVLSMASFLLWFYHCITAICAHMGWKWFPTVAWMCDESFAINVSTKLPDDVDEKMVLLPCIVA